MSNPVLHAERHAAGDVGLQPMEIIITPDTTYVLHRSHRARPAHLHRRARVARRDRAGLRRLFHRHNGSTRTAMAATTRSKSRPAASRDRAPTTPAASRCTPTTRRSSRSASTSTRPIRTSCTTRSPTIDHALTRPWTVTRATAASSRGAAGLPEHICVWENKTLRIGEEVYVIGEDGLLAPTKKDQRPRTLQLLPWSRVIGSSTSRGGEDFERQTRPNGIRPRI